MTGLVIIDTPALYYRAFYSVPSSLTSSDGTPVNALRGTLDAIATLATRLNTTRFIAASDAAWRPTFRTQIVPAYKAHREREDKPGTETPDELIPQIPLIYQACTLLGMPVGHIEDTEADDVIGSVVHQWDGPITVVSPDRDLLSLLSPDKQLTLLRPRPRGQWEETTIHDLPELYGIPNGERYRELAALRGDPSDGLEGAAGIGEKTAAKLLAGYGTLDNLFEAAKRGVKDHGLTPKRRDNLLAAEDAVRKNVEVMTVLTDLDVGNLIEDSATITPNIAGLEDFAQRYGVERSIGRLTETFTSHAPQTAPPTSWADEPLFAFDLETTGRDPHTAHIVSAALIDMRTHETWEWLVYPEDEIPAEATAVHGITTEYARENGMPRAQAIAQMHQVFAERTPACIVAHNAPYDLTIFSRECAQYGLTLPDFSVIDTLVIDKHAEPFRKGPRTLDAVCVRWGVSLDNAHDATADARASGLVALAIADAFPELAQLSAEQIHGAQKEWKRDQAARLQEYLRTRRNPNAVVEHEWPFLTRGEH